MAKALLLFVGTDNGLVRLSNPGTVNRWLRVGHEFQGITITAIWLDPGNPLNLVVRHADQTCMASQDGGVTWQPTDQPPAFADPTTVAHLSGMNPVWLRPGPDGIERSVDQGATWVLSSADSSWQGPATTVIAAPYHMDTAFAGSINGQVVISTDRGASWNMIRHDLAAVRVLAIERLA